jgi:hypothetical protein
MATHSKHHIEGFKDRVVLLYHVISSDSARKIIDTGRIMRGSQGLIGGGIYFAETPAIANHNAIHRGALIEAFVYLGMSLVVRRTRRHMRFTYLKRKYDCDSVRAESVVSQPEYAVYHWAQVCIRKIKIGSDVKYHSGKD